MFSYLPYQLDIYLLIMSLIDIGTVVQSTVCPYSVWLMENLNPSDTLAGKRGILDIIQNPITLSNANTP